MPGYGTLSAMVRSENDPSTVCSEVAPNRIHSSPKPVSMPPRDHRLQHLAAGLVAHPMQQIAARPHLLQREQIAALVVHAGHAIAHELLGNVCQPVAIALHRLLRGKGRPLAHAVERPPVARSVTRPLSSPFASRSKVPPGGFGVFLLMPAISSALLL